MALTISKSQENVEERRPNHRLIYITNGYSFATDRQWEAACLLGKVTLVNSLDLICSHLRGEFSTEATWVGYPPKEAQRISRGGLRQLILDNRLGNRIQYVVEASPGGN